MIDGLEIVDRIASVPTGRRGWFDDVPREAVVIERMERVDDEEESAKNDNQ